MLLAVLVVCAVVPASAVAADPEERIVIKGPVLVDKDETAGDVVVVDGTVLIRGTVDGDLVVINKNVTIRGTVTGDVFTARGRATLGRRAHIQGDLRWARKRPAVTSGARIDGKNERVDLEGIGAPGGAAVAGAWWIAVSVSAFVLGLLLLLLAPRAADGVRRAAGARPVATILFGILAFVLLPVLGVLALVTIVGIPLGAGLLLLVPPLYSIAYVTSAWLLGRRILGKAARILAFLAGLVILRLLALIPVVGGIVWLLATVFGLGALFVALFRARTA